MHPALMNESMVTFHTFVNTGDENLDTHCKPDMYNMAYILFWHYMLEFFDRWRILINIENLAYQPFQCLNQTMSMRHGSLCVNSKADDIRMLDVYLWKRKMPVNTLSTVSTRPAIVKLIQKFFN